MPLFRRVFSSAAAVVAIGCAVGAVGGEQKAGRAVRKQLQTPVDVAWSGVPLRQAVTGLLRGRQVGALIDRRVDPGQPIDLALRGASLDEVMGQIARRSDLGTCLLGSVYYLGPPATASRLRTLAALRREEVRHLPEVARKRLLQSSPLAWKDFSTPRALLAQWSAASGVEIVNAEIIPHDLWAAADLPPMPLVDQLTLLAAQFDLTFQLAPDGEHLRLMPVPQDVALERSYPGGRDPEALARTWADLAPGSKIRVEDGRVIVRGLLEDHERLATPRPVSTSSKPTPSDGDLARQRFTLTVKDQPLDQTLQQLAARLQLQLDIDQEALARSSVSLRRRVSFSVQEAPLDALLRAALEPAGLGFTRQGRTVVIRPAN